jgi:hypothetical protein
MQEHGGPKAQARRKVYQLEADIREAHPGERKILLPMMREARKLVYWQQLEAVDTQVTLIQRRLRVLNQLCAIKISFTRSKNAVNQLSQKPLSKFRPPGI